MISAVLPDGSVKDVTFRRTSSGLWDVCLGGPRIGMVARLKSGYRATSCGCLLHPAAVPSVGGFKTRDAAACYLVDLLIAHLRLNMKDDV
jgi:hypothetical protein